MRAVGALRAVGAVRAVGALRAVRAVGAVGAVRAARAVGAVRAVGSRARDGGPGSAPASMSNPEQPCLGRELRVIVPQRYR